MGDEFEAKIKKKDLIIKLMIVCMCYQAILNFLAFFHPSTFHPNQSHLNKIEHCENSHSQITNTNK